MSEGKTVGDVLRDAATAVEQTDPDLAWPVDAWLTLTFSAQTDGDGKVWIDGIDLRESE